MIGRLQGTLLTKQPPQILVDVNGIGYEVDVPMSTIYDLPAVGEKVTLHTHLAVREDAQQLFGFLTLQERALFRDLIKVSGVGGKVALAILSALEPGEISRAVAMGDKAMVTRANGVGPKLALRIVNELKDKVGGIATDAVIGAGGVVHAPSSNSADAVSALQNLGFKPADASAAVAAADAEAGDGATLDALVRLALKKAAR